MCLYDISKTSPPYVSVRYYKNQSTFYICTSLQKPIHHLCLYDIT